MTAADIIAALVAAGLLVVGYLVGFCEGRARGRQEGADGLANEYLDAAAHAPDFIERTWPRAGAGESRPS